MTRKKWLVVSMIAAVLSAGIKIHGYVSEHPKKEETVCTYSVSGEKWTADPENGKLFRHNEINGISLVIEERHMGVNYGGIGLDVQSMTDKMKTSYIERGMTCETGESFVRDGTEWVTLYAENGEGIKILQNTAVQGDGVYIVAYIAAEDVYELGLSDFEKVLNSFKLTD